MTYHSEAFLHDLICRVDDIDAEADTLVRACAAAPLVHGIRAGVLRGVEDFVREHAPHRLSRLIEFQRLIPHLQLSSAAFLPVVDFHLIMIQAARLIYPTLPLRDAMRAHALQGCHLFFDNPLFNIVTLAVNNDLAPCLENLIQGASAHLFNYGRRELERLGPRSYRFVFCDDHPDIFSERIPPFLEVLIRRFQCRGEVSFEAHDEAAFSITMRWE
jgi:uncharacterized protein (TIGR02265 family)